MNPSSLSRRGFLATAPLLGFAARSVALEPITRPGTARLRLALAAYSFRQYFRDGQGGAQGKPVGPRVWTMKEFIDWCAAQGCDGAEVTSYYFPAPPSNDYLLDLRRHAFLRGVSLSGTAVGNTFTVPKGEKRDREIASVKEWIARAQLLGAPHIRVFAGNLEGQTLAQAQRNCIEALEECGEVAARAGVFLGIENHGGIVAEAADLLEIVRAVKNPWIGINLDTGNFHSDDPYADLERCAPYSVNVQVKVELRRREGKPEASDLGRLAGILRRANYQGWVALEYESAEDPFVAVPRHLKALGEALRAQA